MSQMLKVSCEDESARFMYHYIFDSLQKTPKMYRMVSIHHISDTSVMVNNLQDVTRLYLISDPGGVDARPLLSDEDLKTEVEDESALGGLVVCGSYVPKSTEQLQMAFDRTTAVGIEVNVEKIFREARNSCGHEIGDSQRILDGYVNEIGRSVETHLKEGQDVILFTSRTLQQEVCEIKCFSCDRSFTSVLILILFSDHFPRLL
jgi:hypothetical protein